MVLTVLAVALPFLPLALALLYARRDDEWKSITERERFNRAFTFSGPVSAHGPQSTSRRPGPVPFEPAPWSVVAASGGAGPSRKAVR